MIVFGPSGRDLPPLDLGPLQPYLKPMVTSLGVKVDNALKLDKQINHIVKSSFYHLRLLAKVLSFKDFERVIHAFVTTRLDYCYALYWYKPGLPNTPAVSPKLGSTVTNRSPEI